MFRESDKVDFSFPLIPLTLSFSRIHSRIGDPYFFRTALQSPTVLVPRVATQQRGFLSVCDSPDYRTAEPALASSLRSADLSLVIGGCCAEVRCPKSCFYLPLRQIVMFKVKPKKIET